MKESTRELIREFDKDMKRMSYHNNSKIAKRSYQENLKAYEDKKAHYVKKWAEKLAECETDAQRHYCELALDRAQNLEKWFFNA